MLPDPPPTLAAAPSAFYDQLREMLGVVRPADLDVPRVAVNVDRHGGLQVTLPHVRQGDWTIVADIGAEHGIVSAGPAHEHFGPESGARPWSTEAVDFVAEVLRGELEIESVYRGDALVKLRYYLRDQDGEGRRPIGELGLLRPGLLMRWRPTRTETTRIEFAAQG